jgi:hypothetical protein
MPFFQVHLNSGDSEIVYAHSRDQAKEIATRKFNSIDQVTDVEKVEQLFFGDE